ncbi:MAG TPA: sigma-70 family RNA polymerase sigma factor, partial [Verrucomicrobiae bacterium]
MTDVPDARLLEQFARNGSEDAFAALVQRHIALVHSVALRHTANAQHAQDITQAVFVILARKAGTLGRRTVLPGWLYHTARLTAANFQRAETRRVRREQEAFMQSKLEESPTDNLWRELSPQLDEAMAGLGTSERDALVLRYFQNKSMAEVGKFLGLEENTAQKRVGRALEKLRKFFMKRGVDSTAAAIAENISAHSIQAAPVALAKSVTAVALAKGATASLTTLTLIKGALRIMALTKAKTAVVIGAAVLLTAGTTTLVVDKVVYKNAWADNPK